jgi:hypothetical protein
LDDGSGISAEHPDSVGAPANSPCASARIYLPRFCIACSKEIPQFTRNGKPKRADRFIALVYCGVSCAALAGGAAYALKMSLPLRGRPEDYPRQIRTKSAPTFLPGDRWQATVALLERRTPADVAMLVKGAL